MRSILFVDDEPRVLEGLSRMLYGLRREWRMEFVESGLQALERLAAVPFDVVVSDMRMPNMDGAQLLHEVRSRYPATMRIVLSGQCDRQTVLKAVGSTHQFLTKPCDPEMLKATLLEACRRRDQVADDWYKALVLRVTSVPSLPRRHAQLVAELQSEESSIDRIGEIVATDVGMTAKIMQLVSSGFFGTPQRIADPARAVSLFDIDTIRALASSAEVFSTFTPPGLSPAVLQELFDHSLRVARTAREIARAEEQSGQQVEDAYLAGFLHDVGVLVLAEHAPERYGEILAASRRRGLTIVEAEREYSGAGHADIGSYLMALWGLPESVIQAIAFHHVPGNSPDQGFTPLTAVHVANAADERQTAAIFGAASRVDLGYLERLGLACRLDAWQELCTSSGLPSNAAGGERVLCGEDGA